MSEHEFYRQEVVIDVTGDEQAKVKLKAMDNFLERTSARARKLDKARVSPTVSMNDKISGRLNSTMANLRKLTSKGWKVTLSIKDNISNKLNKLRGNIWSMTKRIATSPLTMLGIGGGLAGVTGHSLGLAGEKEQSMLAYKTMLGGAEKAKQFYSRLENFALKTPFKMPELRDASKLLLAYQFQEKDIIPYLRIIGDTAKGLNAGAEGIDAIIRALGQMKQTGRVNAQDMMQLTNVGVAAWQILADKMGVSVASVRKMSEKGLIPAHKAIQMLLDGMDKGTKNVRGFGGLMSEQARTFIGLASSIQDYFDQSIFTKFGEGLIEGFLPGMKRFVDIIENGDDGLKKMETSIFNLGRTISTKLTTAAEKAYTWIEKLSSDKAFQKMDFTAKLTYIMSKGIDAATPAIVNAGGKIGIAFTKGIVDGVMQAVADDPMTGAIIGLMIPGPWQAKAAAGISLPGAALFGKLSKKFEQWRIDRTSTGALMDFMDKQKRGESVTFQGPATFGPAKKHALGGIFNRPHLGMVAEDGTEGIIPLSRKYRSRALGLYAQVGNLLGISQFAAGGFTGIQPSFAGVGGNDRTISINVPGDVYLTIEESEFNEEVIVNKVGQAFYRKIKESLANRA